MENLAAGSRSDNADYGRKKSLYEETWEVQRDPAVHDLCYHAVLPLV